MQWNSSYQESIFSFANNINTHEGGSHLSGFRSALTRTLNAYARGKGLLKEKDENLDRRGRPRGPDRGDLGEAPRPPVRGADEDQTRQPADRGPGQGDGQPQARRVLRGEPGRGAADHQQGGRRRARPRGRPQSPRPDPAQVGAGELDPARQARRLHGQGPERSPSSSSSRATPPAARPSRRRDRDTQAVLPLRGKIINVEKSRIDKVLANNEIQALITADRHRRARRVRHRATRGTTRSCMATDADVDGAHIRTLVLTFLYRRDAGADRRRLRLHRQAARSTRSNRATRRPTSSASPNWKSCCCATSSRSSSSSTRNGKAPQADRRAAGSATTGASKEYEGWGSSLQAEFGHELVRFLEESQICSTRGSATLAAAARSCWRDGSARTSRSTPRCVEATDDRLVVKAIERQRRPRPHPPPAGDALRVTTTTASSSRSTPTLLKQVGRPPFEVALGGETTRGARSFEALRGAVLELARQGVTADSASRASAR